MVGMSWFNRIQSFNRPSLAICYETGKFQIMRNENDDCKDSMAQASFLKCLFNVFSNEEFPFQCQ